MVVLSKDAKKAYNIFSFLRVNFPNASVCTLRHVSVFIARTNVEFDIYKDLEIKSSMSICKLLLSNGSEVSFLANSDDPLTFIVENKDDDVYMKLYVSKHESDDLSTAFVHGIVVYDDWKYEIGFDSYDRDLSSIKVYYKDKLIEEGTCYFKISSDDDIGLDCIDGLEYLTDIMVKVQLLYDNLRSIKNSKLVRRK